MPHNPHDLRRIRAFYELVAPIYDEWRAPAPFYERIADRLEKDLRARRSASFIDIGCGTGDLAIRVASSIADVGGLDTSQAMLARARSKPMSDRVRWYARWGDARANEAGVSGNWESAGCFHDTMNHGSSPDAMLVPIASLLVPGAVLAFDTTNELGFRSWWTMDSLWDVGGRKLALRSRWHPDRGVAVAEVSLSGVDGEPSPATATLVERFFPDAQIMTALANVGFIVESAEPWSPDGIVTGKTLWRVVYTPAHEQDRTRPT